MVVLTVGRDAPSLSCNSRTRSACCLACACSRKDVRRDSSFTLWTDMVINVVAGLHIRLWSPCFLSQSATEHVAKHENMRRMLFHLSGRKQLLKLQLKLKLKSIVYKIETLQFSYRRFSYGDSYSMTWGGHKQPKQNQINAAEPYNTIWKTSQATWLM